MREFVTEKVKQIKPSGIRKFFDIVSEMPDAISLGVGEPDFDTPWHIREEGIRSLKAGKTFLHLQCGTYAFETGNQQIHRGQNAAHL